MTEKEKIYQYLKDLKEYKEASEKGERWTLKDLKPYYNRDRVNINSWASRIEGWGIFQAVITDRSTVQDRRDVIFNGYKSPLIIPHQTLDQILKPYNGWDSFPNTLEQNSPLR